MYSIEEIYNDIKNGASLERIHRKYGGGEVYIPRQRSDYKERIREEFDGYNHDVLAYKYNTTVRNVRRIVRGITPKQKSLFASEDT